MKLLTLSVTFFSALVSANYYQCSRENCPDQWDNCDFDRRCERALKSCQSCQYEQVCWGKCLKAKRIKSAFLVAKCANNYGCFAEQVPEQVQQQPVQVDNNNSSAKIPSGALGLQECAAQKCPQLWQACQKDNACVNSLLECFNQCDSNQECWTKCLPPKNNGPSVGVALCAQSRKCIETTGPKTSIGKTQQCAQEKCSSQWDSCLKDTKCLPGLFQCVNKCGTQIMCWIGCIPGKGSSSAVSVALCAQSKKCI